MPRVCSHTEPPPPEGYGIKFDICKPCNEKMVPRKMVHAPISPWRMEVNGHLYPDPTPYEKLRSMARILAYSNRVWMISPTRVKMHPHLLPH